MNQFFSMDEGTHDDFARVEAPRRSDVFIVRVLICLALSLMAAFVYWFADSEHVGFLPAFFLLIFALVFKLVKMLHEWYHYWKPSVPKLQSIKKQWRVDVLTTACPGEPREMIIRTLKAMKAIRYPHTNYLCDEGDDPILKQVCKDLGIIHVTRIEKKDAKAGNINNALEQASGEICVVLDPDHIPVPAFLDRVLPYFNDDEIGFVQCVQGYYNQSESFIARGAAEQTYHFYGPMMMSMNSYGTVQAIGANCTFRRKALDSIGGHAAGLAEDMHTSMQLHAKGWKSVYVPEMLTRGLVPATLSAYYKQQLKWSRGTFELLFRTFPKLCKHYTWQQKLHYAAIPTYFLFGLVNLFDIAVPILSLGMAESPWQMNLELFALYFLPLCVISMIIRLYAQCWLLEKHERGFHFAGGILRTATWWIFLIGFIYTIFKIKVPYIPTPKEDKHENYLVLSVPNILVLLVGISFIIYGLSLDWSPYSMAMASYLAVTVAMFGLTVVLSQQKFLSYVSSAAQQFSIVSRVSGFISSGVDKLKQLVYFCVQKFAFVIVIVPSLVFLSYDNISEEESHAMAMGPKEWGTFYFGKEFSEEDARPANVNLSPGNLISVTQPWVEEGEAFQWNLFEKINSMKCIPFIKWKFISTGANVSDVCNGKYNLYLDQCVDFFKSYREPLFLNFVVEQGGGKKTGPTEFKNAWHYLHNYFIERGISNITWAWSPENNYETDFYPGEKYVDWQVANCRNFSFETLYRPFRKSYGHFQKPVMLFCSKVDAEMFLSIEKNYEEIRGIVLANAATEDFLKEKILNQLQQKRFLCNALPDVFPKNLSGRKTYCSPFISGKSGEFELLVNGSPYYIRGVAYNTQHDWRDGFMPLTRKQVLKDFSEIKKMGANTIRRYDPGMYDRNILNIAQETQLKVLYGFWFDPHIDYYADSLKVLSYLKAVEEKVEEYKDHPAVLGWSLGNETWGLLKHSFEKPYLSKVRNAYVNFIERLAQRIHEIDPGHPVFSCMEHEKNQLAGEIVAFRDGAPSVDVIGVNSYYREQISALQQIAFRFDSARPYIVSEFGPRGYWDSDFNTTKNNFLAEESDEEKAIWYKTQWKEYVNANKGFNVGGFAYCWHDRMEGSFTWFGLSDYQGRLKPAYFALREEWTGQKNEMAAGVSISGSQACAAGKMYFYKAEIPRSAYDELNFEWKLLRSGSFEKISIGTTADKTGVFLKIPSDATDLRLYLFVQDKNEERVQTSSLPIRVKG